MAGGRERATRSRVRARVRVWARAQAGERVPARARQRVPRPQPPHEKLQARTPMRTHARRPAPCLPPHGADRSRPRAAPPRRDSTWRRALAAVARSRRLRRPQAAPAPPSSPAARLTRRATARRAWVWGPRGDPRPPPPRGRAAARCAPQQRGNETLSKCMSEGNQALPWLQMTKDALRWCRRAGMRPAPQSAG